MRSSGHRGRPPTSDDGGQTAYESSVGRKAHAVVARLLGRDTADLPDDPLERAKLILGVTQDVISGSRAAERERATGAEVAGAAAVYLRRFRLPLPWELMGSELPLEDKRVDLVFHSGSSQQILIDELKFGLGTSRAAADHQAQEYVRVGRTRWGDRFLGVRLCLVSAPMRSTFYSATDGSTSPLLTPGGTATRPLIQ